LRTPEEHGFLSKGAAFLAAHRLYQRSHGVPRPIKKEWLSLHLPFGLGWQTDLLDILDVACQSGLERDPCILDALSMLLSKQTGKGRWCLEARVPFDDGRLVSIVKDAEPVGEESKWVTLAALGVLKRCVKLLPDAAAGKSSPAPRAYAQTVFSDYTFSHSRAEEHAVRAEWAEFGMAGVLDGLLAFRKGHRLQAGWHWGLVLGPKSCREWCSAEVRWVPRKGDRLSWPVARVYFLSARKQFVAEALAARLGIPATDEKEKKRFNKMFWPSLWRVRVARWRDEYDEVAVTLRDAGEFERLMPVLDEALASMA
jgi:hypothetical protein